MLSNVPSRSPVEGDAVLIAAQSGRALAAAARRAGLRPFVADLFGDTDTRGLAAGLRRLRGRFGGRIDANSAVAALDGLAREAGSCLGLVLGSGFEADPVLVDRLAERHRLLGCDGAIFRAVKDPLALSGLLARLGVPHPDVRTEPVDDAGGWLRKHIGGCGGGHVAPAAPRTLPRGTYLQRRVDGTPISFAFLGDGRTARMVATTRQWPDPAPRAPYRFSGAVEPGACAPSVAGAAAEALRAIVAATGLRGLASADCLVDGETWWLLEINPRPGATLDILDRRAMPLLAAHVEACLGRAPALPAPTGAAASAIVYARRSIAAAPAEDWPDHVRDRPKPGSRIDAGAPVCTVVAEAGDAAAAEALLRRRVEAVRAVLEKRGYDHATAHSPAERQRPRRAAR